MINWRYKCELIRVIDGDTCILHADLGFHTSMEIHCRLARVNAPEMKAKDANERLLAQNAKVAFQALIAEKELEVVTFKTEKFGRWLAEIYVGEVCVSDWMLMKGLVRPYK